MRERCGRGKRSNRPPEIENGIKMTLIDHTHVIFAQCCFSTLPSISIYFVVVP
jgi:hypothetical protein